MWRRIAACALITGCGYPPLKNTGGIPDGSIDDAPIEDAAIDGAIGSAGCLSHWLDGTVAVTAVAELTELTSSAADRDPWISADGLRLYFDRDPGPSGVADIYMVSRGVASPTQKFGSLMPMTNLNSSGPDFRPSLTIDELTVVLSSNRGGASDIYTATRLTSTPFGSPDARHMASVIAVGSQHHSPFLSPEGLRLYLSADVGPGGKDQILMASRPSESSDFGSPGQVLGINNNTVSTSDPALSLDERVIVFSTTTGAGTSELWYAARSSSTGSFNAPAKIPTVNSSIDDADPMLSADGCELYFASNRDADGKYHLFRAQIVR